MELEKVFEVFKRRVNGLAYTADYARKKVSGEITKGGKSLAFRVKLDELGCVIGPADDDVEKMKDVPFIDRNPLSSLAVRHSIATILRMFDDPSDQLSGRTKEVNEWLKAAEGFITTWKQNPSNSLHVPGLSLSEYKNEDGESFINLVCQKTGKGIEDFASILAKLQEDIEVYLKWQSSTTKTTESVEVEGVV